MNTTDERGTLNELLGRYLQLITEGAPEPKITEAEGAVRSYVTLQQRAFRQAILLVDNAKLYAGMTDKQYPARPRPTLEQIPTSPSRNELIESIALDLLDREGEPISTDPLIERLRAGGEGGSDRDLRVSVGNVLHRLGWVRVRKGTYSPPAEDENDRSAATPLTGDPPVTTEGSNVSSDAGV